MQNHNIIKIKDVVVQWIRDWFQNNGKGCNAVVGISGGKDSSVVAALCVEALGADRVIGVLMPNLKQDDIDFSYRLVEHLRIKYYLVPVSMPIADTLNQIRRSGITASQQAIINLPARIRMATLYAISQSLNGRVANTSNYSEDYIGWATRYGDGAGDFCPIARLTSTEVVALGKALGLPDELVNKPPSDGLTGKTDEDNFGFSYEVLDRYIMDGECADVDVMRKIYAMHTKNAFKLHMPPCCEVWKILSQSECDTFVLGRKERK